MKKKKGRIGGTFDDFLKDDGLQEEVHAAAIKRVIAWQLEEAMKTRGMTKAAMARLMNTSRSQLDRLLDPDNRAVELQTLARAAHAVGRELKVELV